MRRAAIVCAFNPRNSGMYSVDLAVDPVLRGLGWSPRPHVSQNRTRVGRLRFELLRDPRQLQGHQALVYWGDFQNNALWALESYVDRERRLHGVRDPAEALANWQSLYLPDPAQLPDDLRVVAAGGCFLGLQGALRERPELAQASARFLQRCDAVIVRDTGSQRAVQRLGQACDLEPRGLQLGFDCASLADWPAPSRWRGGWFAHAFGRGLPPDDAARLVAEVERTTGLRGLAIDWLIQRRPRRLSDLGFRWHRRLMRHARFCLTDTYHFALNAMGLGSLPIMVGRAAGPSHSTLNEAKKQILYAMVRLGAARLELSGPAQAATRAEELGQAAERIAELARELAPDPAWREGFLACRQRMAERLAEALA